MTTQPELALCVEGGDLPPWFFNPHEPYSGPYMDWLDRSSELDDAYPVEEIDVPGGRIELREIEGGVWLWGCRWYNKRTKSGGGIPPLRRWGPEHAATSRERALSAARLYVAERMR